MTAYAIKIRPVVDADLLKMLDPTGSAMLTTTEFKKDSWLIIYPADPSKNVIVGDREFNSDYAGRIASNGPMLFKINKS